MRNVFDQYVQPENRLTHALITSLNEDHALLAGFIEWSTGQRPQAPITRLRVREQSWPGEEELLDDDEVERRGLPDGCIHDEDGWALLLECKIDAPLEMDQLRRHRRTAVKRGITNITLLALVAHERSATADADVVVRKWTELYKWLKQQEVRSGWAVRLSTYMEVLESKLPKDRYLKEGTLTVFAGIPFTVANPYNYLEAKRLLQLAMMELRKRDDLKRTLGVDASAPGRGAITGQDGTSVWDFLRLEIAKGADTFTSFPHLTLDIQREFLQAIVIVPHGIRSDFRRNLLGGGLADFRSVFSQVLQRMSKSFRKLEGVVPTVEIIQRRYPSQRAEPFVDALLSFDLRTAFENSSGWPTHPKLQLQWLDSAFHALSNKQSNLQIAVGAKFLFRSCPEAPKPEILDRVAETWIACKPLIRCPRPIFQSKGRPHAPYSHAVHYADAEMLVRHALDIDEDLLGQAHPTVATNLNNLAALLKAKGGYAEAEPLMRRALDIDEKVLGLEHPNVARDCNNLADLMEFKAAYTSADPLIRRALDIDEKVLGPEHPTVAANLNNLAQLGDQRFKDRRQDAP
jgi:tetratricopeptide (TPR) repeat protein